MVFGVLAANSMGNSSMHSLVSGWVVFSAACVCLGWLLSALGQLNAWGYGIALMLGVSVTWWRRPRLRAKIEFRKLRRRFRRLLPFCYVVLLGMAFVGGALYTPKNWDTLAYRTPRALNWLAEGQWHWIATTDFRMNIVGNGYEWLTVPLIALTKSDRPLFLINAFSYALLPGLVFSFLRRVGVAPRVAWWWMWLLPAGYTYALQAGSTANDAFSAIYALAAMDFALRARETKEVSQVWLSIIAAGLVTGTKQTNLPLLLPWLICVWPSLKLMLGAPLRSAVVGVVGFIVSALPVTIFNIRYAGNWKGWPEGGDFRPESPFWGIVGNTFALLVQNFFPSFFPFAESWNANMRRFVETTSFGAHFATFENFGFAPRAMTEQSSGLGFTVCLLLLVAVVGSRWMKGTRPMAGSSWYLRLVRWSPWISLFVFMTAQGTYQNARYLAAYYPLLLPVFLLSQNRVVRCRWFHCGAVLVMVVSIVLVAMSRYRPMFPAQMVSKVLKSAFPSSGLPEKFRRAYAFVGQFNEVTDMHRSIPANERVVGYATLMGIQEVPLWRPFGSRRVYRIRFEDSPESLRAKGIRYVLLDVVELTRSGSFSLEAWLQKFNAQVVGQQMLSGHPETPPLANYLIQLVP